MWHCLIISLKLVSGFLIPLNLSTYSVYQVQWKVSNFLHMHRLLFLLVNIRTHYKNIFFWRRYASITLETTILAFYYNLLIYIYIGNLSHSNLPCSKSMPTHNRPRVAIIQLSKEGFSFSNNSLLPPTNNTCTQSLRVAFACTIFLLYTTYSELFPFRKFLGFFLLH